MTTSLEMQRIVLIKTRLFWSKKFSYAIGLFGGGTGAVAFYKK